MTTQKTNSKASVSNNGQAVESAQPPSEKRRSFKKRGAIIVIEVLAVIAVLFILALGLMAWRLHSGPLDISFAQNYIENILQNPERGTHAKMQKAVLHWPDLEGPLYLGFENLKIIGLQGETILGVDEAALSISKAQLLLGRISLIALVLKKPALRVLRYADGRFDIGFRGEEVGPSQTRLEDGQQTALASRVLNYIVQPGGADDPHSPLGSLQAFRIEEASLTLEDRSLNTFWHLPRTDILFQSKKNGVQSIFYAELSAPGEQKPRIKGEAFLSRDTHETALSLKLESFNPHIITGKISALPSLENQDIVLDATLEAVLNEHFIPETANISVSSDGGQFYIEDFAPEPAAYKNLHIDMAYNNEDSKVNVSKAQVTVKDVTFKGQSELSFLEDAVTGTAKIMIDELPQDNIAALWPAALAEDNAREWLVDKIKAGLFKDVSANLDFAARRHEETGWEIKTENIGAEFSFKNATVDYRPPLIPVTEAAGRGVFDNDQETLAITVDTGKIGKMSVQGAQLDFADIIMAGKGKANINVKLTGPVASGMEYISREPIGVAHGFDISAVRGQAALDLNIKFPTTKDIPLEAIQIAAQGTLNNLVLPDVVKDLDLTGGPFSLRIQENDIELKGQGEIAGRPASISYKTFIESGGQPYMSKVQAALDVDEDLRDRLGIDLRDFLSGPARTDILYTEYSPVRSEARIKADLKPARLFVDAFDYEKEPGIDGSLTLAVNIQGESVKGIRAIKAHATGFEIRNGVLDLKEKGGEVEITSGRFENITIGKSTGTLEFRVSDAGAWGLDFKGPQMDMRPLLNKEQGPEKKYDNPPMTLYVVADTMITADGETVQSAKIYTDIDAQGRFNQLEMDAVVGGGAVYLRYKPDETGKRVFRFEADNAGATLKAFGLYDKIRGGKMVVHAAPIRGIYDRNLVGKAEISNFTVVKAPVLTRLLGALSLPGMIQLLSNQGIGFSKLEADFDWLYRRRGSLLVLKNGRTSGNSLGLTFDGTFDKAKGTMDVSGTIVPLSGINEMISNIPLVGDILSGGTGSIFAATYSVEGEADDPDVTVNPLSVLAPGILRRILFE